MKQLFKEKITLENVLGLFILMCPILDMASFIFRNVFETNFSPSTFLRPIIPIIVIAYLFLKEKMKAKLVIVSIIYGVYALVHLYLFKLNLTRKCI